MDDKKDPRLHIIAVTGIIEKNGKYLILKRSEKEIAYPGYWTVPGGKLVRHEYEKLHVKLTPLEILNRKNLSNFFFWRFFNIILWLYLYIILLDIGFKPDF